MQSSHSNNAAAAACLAAGAQAPQVHATCCARATAWNLCRSLAPATLLVLAPSQQRLLALSLLLLALQNVLAMLLLLLPRVPPVQCSPAPLILTTRAASQRGELYGALPSYLLGNSRGTGSCMLCKPYSLDCVSLSRSCSSAGAGSAAGPAAAAAAGPARPGPAAAAAASATCPM